MNITFACELYFFFTINAHHISIYSCICNVWDGTVVNAPNVKTSKNRLDSHWREEDLLYNHEAPIPGHHLAEYRAKQLEHIDLTIEANVCGHEGS